MFAVVFILSARGLYVCFLERIQTWVNTLAIIFAAYVGGAYIIDTSKKDGEKVGKKLYSKSNRSRSLIKEINDYNEKYDKDAHEKAAEYVVDLVKTKNRSTGNLFFIYKNPILIS